MQSSFVFDKENLQRNSEDISAIYHIMGNYYEGVEKANSALLDKVFHESWFMRDTDVPEEGYLNVEDKSTFISRVRNHGPYEGYASHRVFANTGMVYKNLAFVRINKDSSRNSTCFFLFKINGDWNILDKIWVNPRALYKEAMPSQNNYALIESLVQDYYEGCAFSNRPLLNELLHEQWDLKYLDNSGKLLIKTKNDLLLNLSSEHNYQDYSQLLSIDIYHDKLSIVRIDQPDKLMTSFLIIFKIKGKWYIVNERRAMSHLE